MVFRTIWSQPICCEKTAMAATLRTPMRIMGIHQRGRRTMSANAAVGEKNIPAKRPISLIFSGMGGGAGAGDIEGLYSKSTRRVARALLRAASALAPTLAWTWAHGHGGAVRAARRT